MPKTYPLVDFLPIPIQEALNCYLAFTRNHALYPQWTASFGVYPERRSNAGIRYDVSVSRLGCLNCFLVPNSSLNPGPFVFHAPFGLQQLATCNEELHRQDTSVQR